MKYFLLLISMVALFLFGTKAIANNLSVEWEDGNGSVQQQIVSQNQVNAPLAMEYVSPVAPKGLNGEATLVSHVLARQFSGTTTRTSRFNSLYHLLYPKALMRLITLRMELLNHCVAQNYSSIPCQNWGVSSEHYIFEMRRIII